MPNIQVEISSKTEGSKKITTEIQSNSLPDLLASLKKSKAETNSVLTEIVENRKSLNIRDDIKRSTNEDEESDENDEHDDDLDATNKKQKT
ncbi:unnamed protein product [Chironomus riparius]|uniref:Uncharacterized protein n=1 Tax=Chironomus riparius TaxID=315576 RepID=A0A9N9WXK0_9DIPT|nr:unnamed protein product [Chironomus riparius]